MQLPIHHAALYNDGHEKLFFQIYPMEFNACRCTGLPQKIDKEGSEQSNLKDLEKQGDPFSFNDVGRVFTVYIVLSFLFS